MATSMEKKIAELEMGLLHLQQNIDIPEISLTVHPNVQQAEMASVTQPARILRPGILSVTRLYSVSYKRLGDCRLGKAEAAVKPNLTNPGNILKSKTHIKWIGTVFQPCLVDGRWSMVS